MQQFTKIKYKIYLENKLQHTCYSMIVDEVGNITERDGTTKNTIQTQIKKDLKLFKLYGVPRLVKIYLNNVLHKEVLINTEKV